MARFLYPNFPFPLYRNYSRTPNRTYNYQYSNMNNNAYYTQNSIPHSPSSAPNMPSFNTVASKETDDTRNFKQKNKSNKNNDDYLFDLFGLKIYSDDVLLVSLIYFLYVEGVKDDSLFLVLILLLLS